VLIIGAGFAGFHCARQLERKLEAHEAEVALVTPRNHLIYSSLLPQVSAGLLSPVPLE
jgi:NADH dehydrogenase